MTKTRCACLIVLVRYSAGVKRRGVDMLLTSTEGVWGKIRGGRAGAQKPNRVMLAPKADKQATRLIVCIVQEATILQYSLCDVSAVRQRLTPLETCG